MAECLQRRAHINRSVTNAASIPDSNHQASENSDGSGPGPGRPRTHVEIQDILDLRRLNYKWTKIAEILQVSRATLYRRLEEAGIRTDDRTVLTDQQLDDIIRSIKQDHPNDGEVMIQGHLLRLEVRVSREALRKAIHRVDHENVVARRHHTVQRRVYSVPHPNYIWHLDGHHKLIRWRFVVHGAIDGFSRTVIYLKCVDNNRAETVVDFFQGGVLRFGLPERVRSDHGGENIGVWQFMIASHDGDPSAVLTGSSVHNERIERLWRDVHHSVTSIFAHKFRSFEADDVLDPMNDVDLYCLHHVFLPIINKRLEELQESWNNHALSTEGNKTPYQLFFEGLHHVVENYHYNLPLVEENSGMQLPEFVEEQVNVPRLAFTPCPLLVQNLPNVDLSANEDNQYSRTLEVVGQHLLSGCTNCQTV